MGPPEREAGPLAKGADVEKPPQPTDTADSSGAGSRYLSSQQVNWLTVHDYVAPMPRRTGSWPMAGRPAWCALPDGDPAKTAAMLDAASHWALRLESCQAAQCEASRAVSAAADWSAIAKQAFILRALYEHRPWLRQRPA